MEVLCEVAHDAGCARIDWVVARDNESGRAFYSKFGAEIFEQVRHARLNEAAIRRAVMNNAWQANRVRTRRVPDSQSALHFVRGSFAALGQPRRCFAAPGNTMHATRNGEAALRAVYARRSAA